MPLITRLAALAAVALAFAAPAALADDCDDVILPGAFVAVQAVSQPGSSLVDLIKRMDSNVQSCPDHAWINALGGELDLVTFKTLRTNNGGVANQDAVNFLSRAFVRSDIFQKGADEDRRNRYNLVGLQGNARLEYQAASNSRAEIIKSLAGLALAGTVHPYLKPEQPPACEGWLQSDAQTVAYMITTAADKLLLPFVEAAADACRTETRQMDRLPLAFLAQAHMKLVDKALVTDASEIERLLIAARRAADDFKGNSGYHSLIFTESDDHRLKSLIRKHGVHTGDGPATIDRSLWFTKEYIGSEVAIRSLAVSFGAYWTPVASGDSDASGEEVAKARSRFSVYIIELRKEGAEAGFPEETTRMLTETLTAFQDGEIGPPETMNLKPFPPWLLTILINLAKPPEPAIAE